MKKYLIFQDDLDWMETVKVIGEDELGEFEGMGYLKIDLFHHGLFDLRAMGEPF
jgi:hypothetical protein